MPDHRDRDQAEEVSRPARTPSKARSRSGNPAVRAGEAGPVATSEVSIRRRSPVVEAARGASWPEAPFRPTVPPIRRSCAANRTWWRSVAGVVFGISLFALVTMVVSQALVMVFWATTAGNQPYRDYFAKAFAFETPLGMLAVNLGLAGDPDRVGSDGDAPSDAAEMALVGPAGIRWRYLFGCLAIAAVVLNGVMLLSTMVGEPCPSTRRRVSGASWW